LSDLSDEVIATRIGPKDQRTIQKTNNANKMDLVVLKILLFVVMIDITV
jgi:hypothetical protein